MDWVNAQTAINLFFFAVIMRWIYITSRMLDRIRDLEEFIRWASRCEDCRKEEEEARLKSKE